MKRLVFIIIVLVALVSWFVLASFQRAQVSVNPIDTIELSEGPSDHKCDMK